MKIGIVIGRIGGLDGVALETEKWIDVLERIGHEVFILSGEYQNWAMKSPRDTLFPVLSFFSPETEWEQRKAFFEPDSSPDALLNHVEKTSETIANKLEEWVNKHQIDCLLSENASALPCHISMGIGIKKFIEKTGMPIVTHDHDFHWERGDRYVSVHKEINDFVDANFPLLIPHVRHAVINTFGVDTFKNRFGLDVMNVPNVMDFNIPYGIKNDNNKGIMNYLGVKDDEIALLQVTRIVRRKGIETAIDLIEKLNDKKLKLVITGNHDDDENNTYYNELVAQIHDLNLTDQVIFSAEKYAIHPELTDVYAHGRACTYFSTYEGFGNAFVECVLSKKPIFVNNYKPVYMPDIGSKGFKTVMLEENVLTNDKIKDMADVIYNPKLATEIGDYNFEVGKKNFSYEVLEDKLRALFSY